MRGGEGEREGEHVYDIVYTRMRALLCVVCLCE